MGKPIDQRSICFRWGRCSTSWSRARVRSRGRAISRPFCGFKKGTSRRPRRSRPIFRPRSPRSWRAMRKEPAERYQSADEMLGDVERVLANGVSPGRPDRAQALADRAGGARWRPADQPIERDRHARHRDADQDRDRRAGRGGRRPARHRRRGDRRGRGDLAGGGQGGGISRARATRSRPTRPDSPVPEDAESMSNLSGRSELSLPIPEEEGGRPGRRRARRGSSFSILFIGALLVAGAWFGGEYARTFARAWFGAARPQIRLARQFSKLGKLGRSCKLAGHHRPRRAPPDSGRPRGRTATASGEGRRPHATPRPRRRRLPLTTASRPPRTKRATRRPPAVTAASAPRTSWRATSQGSRWRPIPSLLPLPSAPAPAPRPPIHRPPHRPRPKIPDAPGRRLSAGFGPARLPIRALSPFRPCRVGFSRHAGLTKGRDTMKRTALVTTMGLLGARSRWSVAGKIDGSEFEGSTPTKDTVALVVPPPARRPRRPALFRSGAVTVKQGALMGETAKDYVVTATLAYVVNTATGAVLGLVKAVTNYPRPASTVTPASGVRAPSLSANSLPADGEQAGAARLCLEARRQGEDRRRQRVRHDSLGRAHPRGRHGRQSHGRIWQRQLRDLLGRGRHAPAARHERRSDGVHLLADEPDGDGDQQRQLHQHSRQLRSVELQHARPDFDALYAYTATPGSGGDLQYGATENFVTTTAANETLSLHSRWLETGAGRADVQVTGGDVRTAGRDLERVLGLEFLLGLQPGAVVVRSERPGRRLGVESSCAFASAALVSLSP